MNAARENGRDAGRALAVVEATAGVPASSPAPSPFEWTREDIVALRTTIAKDCNDAQFRVFQLACARLRLDPFARQITPIVDQGRMTPQVTIDGLRLIAQRTHLYKGQKGPYWCGKDGLWKKVWTGDGEPLAAMVGVLRADLDVVIWDVAHMRSYRKSNSRAWQQLPIEMLAKVAESRALRRAFPNELSGVYTPEEMGSPALDAEMDPMTVVDAEARRDDDSARQGDGEHERLPAAPELRARLLATGDADKLSLLWARWWNETNHDLGKLLARVEKREAEYRRWVSNLRARAYDAGMVRDEEGWADLVVSIVERNDLVARPPTYAEWKRVGAEVETVAEQIDAERRTETPDEGEGGDEHRLDELPIDGTQGRS